MKQATILCVVGVSALTVSPLGAQSREAEMAWRRQAEQQLHELQASHQVMEVTQRAAELAWRIRASEQLSALRASDLALETSQRELALRLSQRMGVTPYVPDAAPARFFPADSADELFRQARVELRRRNYQAAMDLFRDLQRQFPNSQYVPQAMYYEAFALHRIGGEDNLRRALDVLDHQLERFPNESRDAASLRIQVIGALSRQGDAEAAAEIAARAERLAAEHGQAVVVPSPFGAPLRYGGVAQEEDDVRMQALNALLQMDSESAIPILKRVLQNRTDDNVRLRRRAIFLVSQKRSDEREEILLDAVRNDPDQEVKEQAVFFLSQVRTDAAVDALDSILQNATDRQIQERAIFALSQHRSERAGEILRDYVRRSSAPSELRARAIQSLGQRRGNAPFLRELYGQVDDPELRAQLLFAISQTRDQENVDFIIGIAADNSVPMETRKRALFWAGQMRQARPQLLALYDRATDVEFKEQLIFVYGQSRDSSAVTKLIDIARRETNTRLQSRAIFWLGQSRDARAVSVLEEIINRGRI